jgi:four helix bundle protein
LATSGTSVGANYRASCSARSHREFIASLGVVHEETDESDFWLEPIARAGLQMRVRLAFLLDEVKALRKIFGKSLGTARANGRRHANARRVELRPFAIDGLQRAPSHKSPREQMNQRANDKTTNDQTPNDHITR